MQEQSTIVINGWTIFAHPLFLDELTSLINKVKALKDKDPINYSRKNASKRLAAIFKLAFEIIPENPALPEYRQGSTLGDNHRHWFRAKFFQQYRLFFRFHSESKIIIFTWVNNEKNKRAYESKTDAYKVFEKMLNNGHPPDNWDQLLKNAKDGMDRLNKITRGLTE